MLVYSVSLSLENASIPYEFIVDIMNNDSLSFSIHGKRLDLLALTSFKQDRTYTHLTRFVVRGSRGIPLIR